VCGSAAAVTCSPARPWYAMRDLPNAKWSYENKPEAIPTDLFHAKAVREPGSVDECLKNVAFMHRLVCDFYTLTISVWGCAWLSGCSFSKPQNSVRDD
jgi:hypothetical protein